MSGKLIVKDLDTFRRIYEPEGKKPEMLAPSEGMYGKGQEVVVEDGRGNSVKCIVRSHYVAVVPDWETYNAKVNENQGAML